MITAETLLDPDVASALSGLAFPPVNAGNLARFRETRLLQVGEVTLSDEVERTDHRVPGATGDPDVLLRVHRAKAATGLQPCVYWVHGGGYVMGTYETEDLRFDRWCQRMGCVGVAVEYRLAPETPYPGPLNDCYAGLRWVHAHAEELGVDANRIGIGGGSAGGGLAAGLGLLTRDRAEVPLAFQLLIYPMIDDRMITDSSQWDVPIWPPSSNKFGWSSYLGPLYGTKDVPAYAAPARAEDLRGLPPTYLMVGTLDGFLDEDIEYANRLMRAGVPTELHVYPGGPHGFDGFAPGTPLSRQANRDIREWLARQCR